MEQEPIVLQKPLLDLLLSRTRPSDLISLYCFYYYTAKWQGTDQPKATTAYTAKGLQWSENRVREAKKELVEVGLIEDVTTCNELNRITGHFIRVKLTTTLMKSHSVDIPKSNALEKNIYKNTPKKVLPDRNIIPPTLDMVTAYCKERKNKVNPTKFIDFYESKGWLIGKARMKDWQAAIRTWEGNGNDNKSNKPQSIFDDGIQYDLHSDGLYYHHRTGDLYIP